MKQDQESAQRFARGVQALAIRELALAGLTGPMADMIAEQIALVASNRFQEIAASWVAIGKIMQQTVKLSDQDGTDN